MRWIILIGFLALQAATPAQAREASERPVPHSQAEPNEKGSCQTVSSNGTDRGRSQKKSADQRPNVPFNSYGK